MGLRLRDILGPLIWMVPLGAATFFLMVKFGEQISMERRAQVAVEETLMGLNIPACRTDSEIASYLARAEDALYEADQDAKSYHLKREENQEVNLATRFRVRYLTWQQVEPPACAVEIHERMLAYFKAYERAYTVKHNGILGELLDPVYMGFIGVGVENLEVAWRLIQALKVPPPPPRNNNFLHA
ncbi:hypothetical protein GTO10_02145 [Candidatus Saccharibacteria bacterium]|nr:hypothetical protein [Candidatus Saccharibacteria bacterium]